MSYLRLAAFIFILIISAFPLYVEMSFGATVILKLADGRLSFLDFSNYCIIAGFVAWFIFFWMAIRWIFDRPLRWWRWPMLGTVLALVGLYPWKWMALFAAPGITFAGYLCYWHHLSNRRRS